MISIPGSHVDVLGLQNPCLAAAASLQGSHTLRLYDLRHTMATLALAETRNVKLVATRLGHANEYLVLRRYGQVLPGADREAADRLGEVVRRRVPRSERGTDDN